MKPIKIAHTADWHLNDPNHDEILRVINFMVADIHREQPDLIVIAGDMTESRNTRLESKSARTIISTVLTLSRIAPVVIISGTPSHDGLCPEILRGIDEWVYVSTYPEMLIVADGTIRPLVPGQVYPRRSIFVSTLPTPTKQHFQSDGSIAETDSEIAKAISGILTGFGMMTNQLKAKSGIPHVHVGHYQVSGAFVSETQTLTGVDIDIHPDQIKAANADVVCLGHIHKAQVIKHTIFYSGGITRNTYGELDEKGYYIHTVAETGVLTSEFKKLPARELVILRKNFLEDPIDNKALIGILGTKLPEFWVKIELTVWADEAVKVDQDLIKDHFYECGCDKVDLVIIRKPRETVRSERVTEAVTLPEKIKAMAELRQEVISPDVFEKAVMLESLDQESFIKAVQGGK